MDALNFDDLPSSGSAGGKASGPVTFDDLPGGKSGGALTFDDIGSDEGGVMSTVGNIGLGIGERAANLAGGFVRGVSTGIEPVGDWLQRNVGDFVKEPDGSITFRRLTEEEAAQPSGVLSSGQAAAKKLESVKLGYEQGTSWEDFKSSPIKNFIPFALEQGLVSTPDMVAALANLPAYIAARTGEMGQDRAQNNNLDNATVEDLLTVMPGAVASSMLERIGARGILADTAVKAVSQLPKAVGKAALKEGTTEAGQELIEYGSTNIGTEAGFDPATAAERMAAGAVAGTGFGAAARTATAGIEAARGEPVVDPATQPDGNPEYIRADSLDVPPKADSADILYGADPEVVRPETPEQQKAVEELAPVDLERLDSPRLTAEDRASPLPNDLIDDGKAVMDGSAPAQPVAEPLTSVEPVPASEPVQQAEAAPAVSEPATQSSLPEGDQSMIRATLLEAGETNETIDSMSQDEIAETMDQARASGVTPSAEAMQRAAEYEDQSRLFDRPVQEPADVPAEVTPSPAITPAVTAEPAPVASQPKLPAPQRMTPDGFPADRGGNVRKPKSIVEFLAERGGIRDPKGDLAAMGLTGGKGSFVGGSGSLVRKGGMPLDYARKLAVEAGYLTDTNGAGPSTSTVTDLLDAIDQDARNGRQFFSQADANHAVRWQQDQQARQDLEQYGSEQEYRFRQAVDQVTSLTGAKADDPVAVDIATMMAQDDVDFDTAAIAVERKAEENFASRGRNAQLDPVPSLKNLPFFGDENNEAFAEVGTADGQLADQGSSVADAGAMYESGSGNRSSSDESQRPGPERGTASTGGTSDGTRPVQADDGKRAPEPRSEVGADGKPQLVIPGAEQISQREQAQRKADEKLKPKVDQRDAGGMFGDDVNSPQLFDKPTPKVENTTPKVSEEASKVSEKPTPDSVEGKKIDAEWSEFSKSSGTIAIPRSEMPQIKAEHRGAMVNFLNARGISHQEETVAADSLIPTQKEFSRDKVAKAKKFEGGDRSILVANDGHILDGHHQWLAKREAGEDIKVIRLDAAIRRLLTAVGEFPSATNEDTKADGDKPATDEASYSKADTTALSEDFKSDIDAVTADLRKRLDKLGLPDVALRVVPVIEGYSNGEKFTAHGSYFRGLIDISLQAPDKVAPLNHEAIHALKNLNAFTKTEWSMLSAKSKSDWMNRYGINEAYAESSESVQIEEGIAAAYTEWAAGREKAGPFARLFQKIRDIIASIGNALRGNGYDSVGKIFVRVESGDVGNSRFFKNDAGAGGTKRFSLVKSFGASIETEAFKRWFGDSKVVDANGNPMVVYHGTRQNFESFESSKGGEFGSGIYFSDDSSTASYFGSMAQGDSGVGIYPVYLSLQNPLITSDRNMVRGAGTKKLRKKGYDGIIGIGSTGEKQYIVFSPNQVKSVNNRGTFSPEDDRILYQLKREPKTAQEKQEVMQGFIARGQPIDRAIRLPFEVLGGINKDGTWKPALKVNEKLGSSGRTGLGIGVVIGAGIGTFAGGPIGTVVGGAAGATAGVALLRANISRTGRFGWMYPVAENARRGLIDRYGLSEEYVEVDRSRQISQRGVMQKAQDILQVLQNASVGPAEAKVLQAVLTGENVTDTEMMKVAAPIRKAIDELGAEAVSLGLISAESFERNRGAYLHRVYQKNEMDQSGVIAWASKVMSKQRVRIMGDQLKGRGIFWDVSRERLLRYSRGAVAVKKADGRIGDLEDRIENLNATRIKIEAEMSTLGKEFAAQMGRRVVVADRATIKKMVGESRKYKPSSFQKGQVREQAAALNRIRDKLEQREAAVSKIDGQILEAQKRIDQLSDHLISQSENLQIVAGQKFVVLDKVVEGDAKTQRVYLKADEAIPERFSGDGWVKRGDWEVRGIGKDKITIWRDYTKDERTKMGEVLDARYTIAKTFMMMANDLSTGRFYKQVAENEEWAQIKPPAMEWREAADYGRFWNDPEIGWVRVPETTIANSGGKKRYGALSGMFVRAEIWRDLNEVDQMSKSGFWRTILTQWKLNKTARSPVTHTNNILSNMMFMDMGDVRLQDLTKGIKSFAKGDAEYIAARDAGAFGGDMIAQEIRKEVLQPILDDIAKAGADGKNPLLARMGMLGTVADKIWTWAKVADDRMLTAYQMEDEVFRMATYLRRRSLGDSVEVSAKHAREQFLDYDIRAPWVNAARNSVLPFISYSYRAIPKIAENVMNRPWKVAKYFALAYAANMLAYMWDDGDDGEDRERASLRDEEQGYTWFGIPRMMRMPYRDADGMPVFLDVRRWIPSGDVFDTNQGQSAIPVPSSLQLGGPLLLAFEFALNKQSFTGNEITNDLTDTSGDKAAKVGDWLWKSWMPSAAWVPNSWYWEKIENALKGAEDYTGRKYSLPEAALSSVGIKLKPQNVDDGLGWKQRAFKEVERELRTEGRRLANRRERGLISQSEFDKSMAQLSEKFTNLGEKAKDLGEQAQPKPKP